MSDYDAFDDYPGDVRGDEWKKKIKEHNDYLITELHNTVIVHCSDLEDAKEYLKRYKKKHRHFYLYKKVNLEEGEYDD